jgi:hypothetical protein
LIQPAGTYTLNTAHHIDIVFNETGASIDYGDPTGSSSSLATGFMDIWVDGVRVAAGVSSGRAVSPSAQVTSVNLRNAASQQEIYIDNFEIMAAGGEVDPPPGPDQLLLTNLVASGGTVRVAWDPPSDRFIVVGSGQVEGMMTQGVTAASGTTATHEVAFPHAGSPGFFLVRTGLAAVDGVTSTSLWNEVKAQSTAVAPTNRIYDVELAGVVGLTLPGQAFSVAELAGFARLEFLSLADSALSSLGDLSPVAGLTWLNLTGNRLTDTAGLNVLTQLEALNLQSNLLSNVAGIESLTRLRWLDLEHNQLTDLALVVTNAANGGLGEGDALWVRGNPLSATATNQLQSLESLYKVKVYY